MVKHAAIFAGIFVTEATAMTASSSDATRLGALLKPPAKQYLNGGFKIKCNTSSAEGCMTKTYQQLSTEERSLVMGMMDASGISRSHSRLKHGRGHFAQSVRAALVRELELHQPGDDIELNADARALEGPLILQMALRLNFSRSVRASPAICTQMRVSLR